MKYRYGCVAVLLAAVSLLTRARAAGTIVVTTTAEFGPGSLGTAIQQAALSAPPTTNSFNIPGIGVQTISLLFPLPVVPAGTTIDGYTQHGASPNSLPVGDNAVILIQIDATNIGSSIVFDLASPGCVVKGVSIVHCQQSAILDEGQSVVSGCFLGVDATGAPGGNVTGVFARGGSVVGGTTPADRNVISGNSFTGILVSNDGNKIEGNIVGADPTGTKRVGNAGAGVTVRGATNTTISGNEIVGNSQGGLVIDSGSTGNIVAGNTIGTDAIGTRNLANGQFGIQVAGGGSNNRIGDPTIGGNTIANNVGPGVEIVDSTSVQPVRNSILQNSMYGNGLGGILFVEPGSSGRIPNDVTPGNEDSDEGANRLQNFPEVTNCLLVKGSLFLIATVPTALVNATYPLTVDVYLADSTGTQGLTWLGSGTYPAGFAAQEVTVQIPTGLVRGGDVLIATATDADGNTSQFSDTFTVPLPTDLYVSLSGNDGALGTSASPVRHIGEAVYRAGPGTVIHINPGLYKENIGLSRYPNLTILNDSATGTVEVNGSATSASVFNLAADVKLAMKNIEITSGMASQGGGIRNAGQLTMTGCTVANNQATTSALASATGGGIYNAGSLDMTNCTISGNSVDSHQYPVSSPPADYPGFGGGLFNAGTATITNCTITNNQSVTFPATPSDVLGHAGGIYSATSNVTLQDSIVGGNSAGRSPDAEGTFTSKGFDLIGNTQGLTVSGDTTTNLLNVDPKLAPLANNGGPTPTHALLAGSPAIDAVLLGDIPPTDQRGEPRPFDGTGTGKPRADIGAYESVNVTAYTVADAARALRLVGGHAVALTGDLQRLNIAANNPSAAAVDILDAVRLIRKSAGLEP